MGFTEKNKADIDVFLKSDNLRSAFVAGINKNKNELVIDMLLSQYKDKTILIRTNRTNGVDKIGIPKENLPTKIVSTKKYKYRYCFHDENMLVFDNMLKQNTWNNFRDEIDIAVIYPVDSLSVDKQRECIGDLMENHHINKIIFVSWVENVDLKNFYCADKIIIVS